MYGGGLVPIIAVFTRGAGGHLPPPRSLNRSARGEGGDMPHIFTQWDLASASLFEEQGYGNASF